MRHAVGCGSSGAVLGFAVLRHQSAGEGHNRLGKRRTRRSKTTGTPQSSDAFTIRKSSGTKWRIFRPSAGFGLHRQ